MESDYWLNLEGSLSSAISEATEPLYTITTLPDIEPLDAQFGAWPRKTVPDGLAEPLFGDVEPDAAAIARYGSPEQVPSMRTYAILDAAKAPYQLTGVLSDAGLSFLSLFQGDAAEDFEECAPYLVELSIEHDLTRRLMTRTADGGGLWDKGLGIYFRSRAPIEELRRHFRKFTRLPDADGKWFYFRFWESSVIPGFLQRLPRERQDQFRMLYCGTDICPIASVVLPRADDFPTSLLSGVPHGLGDNRGQFRISLQAVDLACFRQAMWADFTQRLHSDMRTRALSNYGMSPDSFEAYYAQVLAMEAGRFSGNERDFSTFVVLSFEQGLGFWDEPQIQNITTSKPLQHSGKVMDAVLHHLKEQERA